MSATTMARVDARDHESTTKAAAGGPRSWIWLAQAAVSAVVMALLLQERWGYAAGDSDHVVLSPLGMQWANPGWFANDWTVANAPQPHWFFDVLTWFGTKTGTLAGIYLLYFAASMFVYGAATTLLARKWTPNHSWYAILAVTALTAIAPLYLLGSAANFWPMALPEVLGGLLLYLTTAALLVGRHRLAAAAGIATTVVHVQIGVIGVVLLGTMAFVIFRRERRYDVPLVSAAAIGLIVSIVALRLRPVAGNIRDFARICDDIIPYHCNAASWPVRNIVEGVAAIAISLLTYFYLSRSERARWFVVLVAPAVGLLGGTMANALRIPVLGVLAQGTNVYRLAVVFVPFLAWGMITPVFAQGNARLRWTLLGTVLVGWYLTLRTDAWGLSLAAATASLWTFGVIIALVAACAALTVPNLVAAPERWRRISAVMLVGASLSSIYIGPSTDWWRPFEPGLLQRRPAYTSWAESVQKAVPVGSIIMLPPTAIYGRIATKRAIVADCKYVPYGGEAAREWNRRIADLGGFKQCNLNDEPPDELNGYAALTTDQLETVAKKYGAKYVGLLPTQAWQAYQLQERGWTKVVAMPNPLEMPETQRKNYVFINIWRAPGT